MNQNTVRQVDLYYDGYSIVKKYVVMKFMIMIILMLVWSCDVSLILRSESVNSSFLQTFPNLESSVQHYSRLNPPNVFLWNPYFDFL